MKPHQGPVHIRSNSTKDLHHRSINAASYILRRFFEPAVFLLISGWLSRFTSMGAPTHTLCLALALCSARGILRSQSSFTVVKASFNPSPAHGCIPTAHTQMQCTEKYFPSHALNLSVMQLTERGERRLITCKLMI